MRAIRTCIVIGLLALHGALWSSCVSVPIEDDRPTSTPLIVTKSSEGVMLSWKTQPGERYSIMYNDTSRSGGAWRPMQGAVDIIGTGQDVRFWDRVPPGGTRYYRLIVSPTR